MLFRDGTSLLVACYPALAERRAPAAVVHCSIPFLCHIAVRRALRVFHLLRPRCLSLLRAGASPFRYPPSPTRGVWGSPVGGLRTLCLSAPRRDDHNAIALHFQRPRSE